MKTEYCASKIEGTLIDLTMFTVVGLAWQYCADNSAPTKAETCIPIVLVCLPSYSPGMDELPDRCQLITNPINSPPQ